LLSLQILFLRDSWIPADTSNDYRYYRIFSVLLKVHYIIDYNYW